MAPPPIKIMDSTHGRTAGSPSTSHNSTATNTPTTAAQQMKIIDPMYTEIPNSPSSFVSPPPLDLELLQPTVYCPPHLSPTTPKPIIVLVCDEWHTPLHYARLTGLLNSHGYITIVPELPTNGAEDAYVGLGDDVRCVTDVLENWVGNQGREVVVVMHGYGGLVGSAAASSLSKTSLGEKEMSGGVVGMLYMAAWALPKGVSREDFWKENLDWQRDWVEYQSGFSLPANAQHYLYDDLSALDSEYSIRRLVTHCIAGDSEATVAECSGGNFRVTYLMCWNDNAVLPFAQRKFVETLDLGNRCRVVGCKSGHSPFMDQTKMVARLVRELAGEKL